MGRPWNAIAPQTNSSTASPSTSSRLLSAKSTRPRITALLPSLLHGVLHDQRVHNDALAWLHARRDFLHVVGTHRPAHDLFPLKLAVIARWHVHPLAIVQMEDRCRRHGRMNAGRWPAEGRRHEHPHTQNPGVRDLDADFRGPDVRVEHRRDIADPTRQPKTRVCAYVDIARVADAY